MRKEIVVVSGGWNFIGEVELQKDGTLVMTNASVIRYWGTTAGLGEIAVKGPTKTTTLDFVGEIHIPKEAAPFRIKCVV